MLLTEKDPRDYGNPAHSKNCKPKGQSMDDLMYMTISYNAIDHYYECYI